MIAACVDIVAKNALEKYVEAQEIELFGPEGKEMVLLVAAQLMPKTIVTPAESFVDIHPRKLL